MDPQTAQSEAWNGRQPTSIAEQPSIESARLPKAFWLGFAICLGVLLVHVYVYAFLCDDAFISFRYARNLAQGYGLVFNPGFERVEGYTNFLWVLLLAGADLIGIEPHRAANPMAVLCGVILFVLTVRFCLRQRPGGASAWWALVPAALLATNRSFAMWCTSGLETKLFELLCVAGVFRTITEMQAMADRRPGSFPLSCLLLALATLTRPDGLLISAGVLGARVVYQLVDRSIRWRSFLLGMALFGVPVLGHFLFRRLYYGDWLPNTYYAKIDGRAWWDMGLRYLACFAMEYWAVLWAPLLWAAAVALVRSGRSQALLVILGVIVPHAIYVASIGGDHFEYRPHDLYFPLIFVLFFYGACSLGKTLTSTVAVVANVALVLVASLLFPTLSHLDFPTGYRRHFPGASPREDDRYELIDGKAHPMLLSTPLIGSYIQVYNYLSARITNQGVGLRQEEHASFLACSTQQGLWLRDLVRNQTLPADLHIAIACVGAIPYYSGLRTLDRLGLTDREVARQTSFASNETRMLAHDKKATPDYARRMNVDLWSAHGVHPILPAGHPAILYQAQLAKKNGSSLVAAEVAPEHLLVAIASQGVDALARRVPRMKFFPADELIRRELWPDSGFVPVPRERQLGSPYDAVYVNQGENLLREGMIPEARIHFQRALATNPNNPHARKKLQRWQHASGG